MSENRKRSETLTIRLTKSEKAAIAAKAKRAGMNLTEYIAALSRDSQIVAPPDLSPVLVQLKRIGNNLNQIAAKVNAGVTYAPGLNEVMQMQSELYKLLLTMTENGRWQR